MWHASTLVLMLSLFCSSGLSAAADSPPPASPPAGSPPQSAGPPPLPAGPAVPEQNPKPAVQDLGNQRYRIGAIEIDKEKQLFTVPGVVIRIDPPSNLWP
jgi:hypothetical protein